MNRRKIINMCMFACKEDFWLTVAAKLLKSRISVPTAVYEDEPNVFWLLCQFVRNSRVGAGVLLP